MENWQAQLTDFGPRLITALAILVFSVWVARFLEKMLNRILKKNEKSDSVAVLLLGQILRWSVLLLGGLAALNQFFNVTAFIAGLGMVGLAVGFALQDILQNLVAGIILLVQHPFDVGEAVSLGGNDGTVLGINLRSTELKTWDGRILTMPNGGILSETIINYSRAPQRRVDVPIGIGYDADPENARQALLEAVRHLPGVLQDPAPFVRFQSFGDASVNLTLYFWIDTAQTDVFLARDQAIVRCKAALEKAGVEIPYPIQTVFLRQE